MNSSNSPTLGAENSPLPATPHRRVALWVSMGTATFMASLDNLVVTMALPHIQREFSTSIQDLTWSVNAYTLPFAVLMVAAAMVGDRWGRHRVFLVGISLFGIGSALAASAGTYGVFVAARATQGVGAALLVPLALILLISSVPAGRRALVVAVLSGVQGLGIALGPFVGGLIISLSQWQWVFWINVPIAVMVIALSFRVPSEQTHHTNGLPILSLVLLSLGLFGIAAAALSFSAASRWSLGWGILAIVCLAAGLYRVLRQDHEALPAALLRNTGFLRSNSTALLVTAGIFGIVFILTQYLQVAMGYSPLEAGIATLPWTLLPAVSAPLAGMAVTRVGMKPLIIASTALQILGLAWFLLTIHPDAAYVSLLPGMIMAGLGMGVFFALITGQAIAFSTRSTEGVATGINTSIRESGVLIGVACVGALFALAGGSESPDGYTVGLPAALVASLAFLALGLISSIMTPTEKQPSENSNITKKRLQD